MSEFMKTPRQKLSFAIDILITVMVFYAWACMIFRWGDNGTISAGGFRNLKYFTVLSNLLMAAASILNIVYTIRETRSDKPIPRGAAVIKYVGATATALTFIVVVTFLGTVYKVPGLYSGANLWFHVVVPVLSFIGVIISEGPRMTIRDSLIAVLPMIVYGISYISNILINGMGESPYSNDWYGFLYWGWGPGLVIFLILILISWAAALLMRLIHNKTNGERNGK